jgi:16S rRNA processing protein RimM
MAQDESLEEPMVVLGRIGAPYGIKGWVHVQSYTQPTSNILRYKTWHILEQGVQAPLSVLQGRSLAKGCVVALEGYENPELASQLRHAIVGVPRGRLPALEEGVYYWADLIGMQVHNQSLDPLAHSVGRVKEVFEAGANDVLVVETLEDALSSKTTKMVLIPFVMESVINEVDQEARWIRLCWDEWF